MSKSIIDTELRNNILQFLNNCRLPDYTYDLSVPETLYFDLKPQRTRKVKVTGAEPEVVASIA